MARAEGHALLDEIGGDHLGAAHPRRLRGQLSDHPLVGEVRGIGLIGALELTREKGRRRGFAEPGTIGTLCRDLCIANGLVMRAVRDTMIIAPPLVMTRDHADELIDKARQSLDMTLAEVRRLGLI